MSTNTITQDLAEVVRAYEGTIRTLGNLAQADVVTSSDAMRMAAGLELGPARAVLAKLEAAIVAVGALERRAERAGDALEAIAQSACRAIHDLSQKSEEPR